MPHVDALQMPYQTACLLGTALICDHIAINNREELRRITRNGAQQVGLKRMIMSSCVLLFGASCYFQIKDMTINIAFYFDLIAQTDPQFISSQDRSSD
jgi:hypothetical protein